MCVLLIHVSVFSPQKHLFETWEKENAKQVNFGDKQYIQGHPRRNQFKNIYI